ncbi:DNA-binding XRE family transcriptional regulator [Clostridium pascui]|uniref:helix-turn-helix transcriptional regulator n=1 Tax=Clostridium pascui TaxID=46609 RepID=UPI001956567E|nr:helix-turn-helix transcriptional regulator [Clostridium pascui]MBM7869262.1 DNA-binding XRE family transcriptional regulator [Clostridium pascui]
MSLKNNLKRIRMKEYMMTATEFSKMLDVKKSTYSQWENGLNNPTLEKAYEIAKRLNKNINEIWYEE